jgi:hypothetical protein
MILLTASRLDAYDGFQFRIEGAGETPAVSADADAVAEILLDLGVANPNRLVRHVREWGALEIFDHISPRH